MQLLKLNVPSLFMLVALDEGPGPPIKYQYAELNRLYSVVSVLVRCCDVSSRCLSSNVSLFAVFQLRLIIINMKKSYFHSVILGSMQFLSITNLKY